jgi:hypothetical protein
LESLEIRNAPSHFGALAHAAVALHTVHAAAHMRHFTAPHATVKVHSQETNSGVDRSQDKGLETTSKDLSKDTNSVDTNSVDTNSVDVKEGR